MLLSVSRRLRTGFIDGHASDTLGRRGCRITPGPQLLRHYNMKLAGLANAAWLCVTRFTPTPASRKLGQIRADPLQQGYHMDVRSDSWVLRSILGDLPTLPYAPRSVATTACEEKSADRRSPVWRFKARSSLSAWNCAITRQISSTSEGLTYVAASRAYS